MSFLKPITHILKYLQENNMDTNQCNDDGSCDLWEVCEICEGQGRIYSDWGFAGHWVECAYCNGTGKHIFGE